MFSVIVCVISISCLYNCKGDDQAYLRYVIEGVKFHQALEKARQENKYLWVVIGDTKDTKHTTAFLNELSSNGIFKKHKNNFIYYACNIKENEQYWYILKPHSIPNSYIFDNKGNIISLFEYSSKIRAFVENQLNSVINEKPSDVDSSEINFLKRIDPLNHLSMLINASNIVYYSDSTDTLLQAKKILDGITEDNLNYYTVYLKTQLAIKLNDSVSANNYADLAYQKYMSDSNPLFYSDLNNRIKDYSNIYRTQVTTMPLLTFDKQKIDCGNIKRGKDFKIRVKITNKGTYPLVILQTRVSCSCLIVDYPKKSIMPNESVECNFLYDTKAKGKFSRTVYFESNASNRFEKIILEGQVI